jgi:hypothetical protein
MMPPFRQVRQKLGVKRKGLQNFALSPHFSMHPVLWLFHFHSYAEVVIP